MQELIYHPYRSGTLQLGRWHTPMTGKPVIHFVHGNGFNGRVYSPLLACLMEDFDLVMTDAQGHGESHKGDRFLGWDANAKLLAASVKEFCSLHGLQNLIGVGHSFGGVMTTLMAARHPEQFSHLVLLDPVYLPWPYAYAVSLLEPLGLMQYSPMVKQAANRRDLWPDRQEAAAYFQGRGMFRSWAPESLAAYVHHGLEETQQGVSLKTPPWVEAAVFSSYSRRLWPAVKQLSVKCDIIYGRQTYPFIKQGVRRAGQINPQVSLHGFEGDHCFMMAKPRAVADIVRNFGVDK